MGKGKGMSIWTSAYTRHEPGILAYLKRRFGPEDAEDLCQETFARALAAENAPREEGRVKAYLYRIAHNLMVNRFRRPSLMQSECDLGEHVRMAELAVEPAHRSPEARAHVRDLARQLTTLLAELPPDQRQAFELGVLQRKPYKEIADMTGWSLSKVKGDVFRARQRLIAGFGETAPSCRPKEATS